MNLIHDPVIIWSARIFAASVAGIFALFFVAASKYWWEEE